MRTALFLLALGVAGLAPAAEIRVEPEIQLAGPKAEQLKGKGRAKRARHVELDAPSEAELALIAAPRKSGVPQQIGFGRDVAALADDLTIGRALEWEQLEGASSVAAVEVTSPGAAALRFGLRVMAAPTDAIFRFHDAAGEELFEVTGAAILATIEANLAAGEKGLEGRTYWSPVIESSTAVMEIELPQGANAGDLRVAAPRIAHLVTSASSGFQLKSTETCYTDATCQLGAWSAQINAVARMVFSVGGSQFLCTGTLLADNDTTTTIPYFLTANHCIGSQVVASSLSTFWFWRSTACNSGTLGPFVQVNPGATLLYNSANTDVSFVRLNNSPPAGVTYAGWKSSPGLALSAGITALHQPGGDLLKLSTGTVDAFLTCTPPTNGSFSCATATAGTSTFYEIAWGANGVVEPGSSGSAIFDSGKYVVGQLYGGSSTCANPTAGDAYGRFDISFAAGLATWLNASPAVRVLTVARAGSATGTVTSTPAGISCGATCSASFNVGTSVALTATPASGATFAGWTGACSGAGACNVTMNASTTVTATFNIDNGLAVSPASLLFGSTASTKNVTLTNNTGIPVTISQVQTLSPRFTQSNDCATLAVGVSCTVGVTYNPAATGADISTLAITSTDSGSPHSVSIGGGTASARLTNISTRMQVLSGNDVLIGGFVVGGPASKQVAIVATGPSLVPFGIANALANPTLTLVRQSDQSILATNDNWQTAANAAALQAAGFAPSNPLESAILTTLPPGAYTAIVSGVGGVTGVGIVAVYEVDHPEVPLVNISTRGQVLTGNDVMIGGFVITGNFPRTVTVVAAGPSLGAFGIANPLGNPTLSLVRQSDQSVLATNDDWQTSANAAAIQSSGFAPSHPLESAILITLDPGAYTAIVSGAGGGTGVGIIGVYLTP